VPGARNVWLNVAPFAEATLPAVNDASVPVPADAPLQAAGLHLVTLCCAPVRLTHVTVSPTEIVMLAGAKQKPAQLEEMVTAR